jgi:hypothetical protein
VLEMLSTEAVVTPGSFPTTAAHSSFRRSGQVPAMRPDPGEDTVEIGEVGPIDHPFLIQSPRPSAVKLTSFRSFRVVRRSRQIVLSAGYVESATHQFRIPLRNT